MVRMQNDGIDTRLIIRKWYDRLGFPKTFDKEFSEILAKIEIPASLRVEDYDKTSEDGKKNLLAYLYFCEETERRYREREIPEEILLDTLRDIVCWTEIWSGVKGELWLEELAWLNRHHALRIFRLGRLQFEMAESKYNTPAEILPKGTRVIKIHIPSGGRLDENECVLSIGQAKDFLARYFSEFAYERMICSSWLLDDTLRAYLPPTSNILRFADLFDRVWQEENDSLLQYIFTRDTTRKNLANKVASGGFAEKIKEAALGGQAFYVTLGILKETIV